MNHLQYNLKNFGHARSSFKALLISGLFGLPGILAIGCASPQQTYPIPYGSPYAGGVMPGAPINPGVYAPPVINSAAGTVPPNGVVPQVGVPTAQGYPYGNVPPANTSLPTYGAPQGAYQPGYPQTGYPPVGYPQGVPLNSMIPPSAPILFGR